MGSEPRAWNGRVRRDPALAIAEQFEVGRLALQVGIERLACMTGQLVFHSTHGNDVMFLVARSSPSGETLGPSQRSFSLL